MEVLLPLLIFVGGIIYSVIASSGNKDKEKRNVDPNKMERPGRSAPRGRTSTSQSQRERSSGGFFDEIKREFQSEYDKAMGRTETDTSDSPSKPDREDAKQRPDRVDVKRRLEEEGQKLEEKWQQEKKQASMRQRSRNKTYEDKKPVERKQSERAAKEREKVRAGAVDTDVEVAGAAEGIGREIADEARYSYGDDRTTVHKKGKDEGKGFSSKDLTFDNKSVVNGIIFNEILGKPKSRK